MSLRLQLACNGHRHQNPCRAYTSAAFSYSAGERREDTVPVIAITIRNAAKDGWRLNALPDGGDLCPSGGHDEEPPEPCT